MKTSVSFRLRLLIGLAAAVLFLYGFERTSALEPKQEKGILPTRPPTPYLYYPSPAQPRRRALVVHGLDANKEFMQIFCSALNDAGFEVYAVDLPGHGDSNAGFNGVLAGNVLEEIVSRLRPDIAIGHSMGGALLIDLAHRVTFKQLVLVSPGPTEVNLEFQHTLVTTEQFDLPFVNAFARRLIGADIQKFAWGMHSSALYKPDQIRQIVMWLGGNPGHLHTSERLLWLAVTFGGAIALGLALFPSRPALWPPDEPALSKTDVLLAFVVAGIVSMIVQRIVIVLRWIRLFASDYAVSVLFVTGVVLLLILAANGGKWKRATITGILKGVATAAYVIVVLGLVTGSHLIHMTLSDGRWWRFIVIAAAGFPLFLFDEAATRKAGNAWQNAGIGIVTRLLISAWMATGVLLFNHESAFVVLLLALLPFFWIALWFATGLVARHTQNPVGTALFAALVQGWMFAAWFITV